MEFDVVSMFIDVTRDCTILHGWDIKCKKNDHIRDKTIYKQKGCPREVFEVFKLNCL